MKVIILEPKTTVAIQHKCPARPVGASDDDDLIMIEKIVTKLDRIKIKDGIGYRVGYCDETDTEFYSKIQ